MQRPVTRRGHLPQVAGQLHGPTQQQAQQQHISSSTSGMHTDDSLSLSQLDESSGTISVEASKTYIFSKWIASQLSVALPGEFGAALTRWLGWLGSTQLQGLQPCSYLCKSATHHRCSKTIHISSCQLHAEVTQLQQQQQQQPLLVHQTCATGGQLQV